MPLDHYVSQVHLRKFYSPSLGNRMYAIRKTDLKAFTPDSQSVCRIMDGSTNAYLLEDRAIEDFLKTIEPNYNAALDSLVTGQIDEKCIHTIAGFAAYVMTCSPAGMRIQSSPLKSIVEAEAAIMDAQGLFPPPPPELDDTNLAELLRNGAVEVMIDHKYPQAIGIDSILKLVATLGNCKWEILRNEFHDSPFFSSDFPVAIEETDDPRILTKIIPLAPNLAVRIKPDLKLDRNRIDLSFKNLSCSNRNIGYEEVAKLNCLIVRCAEDAVFYRDNHPWVQPFVIKNRHYHIEPHTHKLSTSKGTLLVSTQRVVATIPSVESTKASV